MAANSDMGVRLLKPSYTFRDGVPSASFLPQETEMAFSEDPIHIITDIDPPTPPEAHSAPNIQNKYSDISLMPSTTHSHLRRANKLPWAGRGIVCEDLTSSNEFDQMIGDDADDKQPLLAPHNLRSIPSDYGATEQSHRVTKTSSLMGEVVERPYATKSSGVSWYPKKLSSILNYLNSVNLMESSLFRPVTMPNSSTPLLLPRANGFLSILAVRFYYSKFAAVLYSIGFLVNIILLLEGIFYTSFRAYALIGELFVTFMMVFEVSMRLLIQGFSFFSNAEGWFDFLLMLACVFLLVANFDSYWASSSEDDAASIEKVSDYLELSLTAFQFSVQLLRIGSFLLRRQRSTLPKEKVDFSIMQGTSRGDNL